MACGDQEREEKGDDSSVTVNESKRKNRFSEKHFENLLFGVAMRHPRGNVQWVVFYRL